MGFDARAPVPCRLPESAAAKGFTLIELLIALVLTSVIVIFLTELYKMTGQTATALKSTGSDWNAEHFIRQQLWLQITEFNTDLKQFKGEKTRLQFASRYSAAEGDRGSYVKVIYRYDSSKQTLEYEEQPYFNWWTEAGRDNIKKNTQQQTPSKTIFKQISDLHFSYSNPGENGIIKWEDTWNNSALPKLIRIDYRRGIQSQTLIFDHQVLSFSIASGF